MGHVLRNAFFPRFTRSLLLTSVYLCQLLARNVFTMISIIPSADSALLTKHNFLSYSQFILYYTSVIIYAYDKQLSIYTLAYMLPILTSVLGVVAERHFIIKLKHYYKFQSSAIFSKSFQTAFSPKYWWHLLDASCPNFGGLGLESSILVDKRVDHSNQNLSALSVPQGSRLGESLREC